MTTRCVLVCVVQVTFTLRPQPRKWPSKRPRRSARNEIPSWLLRGTYTLRGGGAWTDVTTAGCPTGAPAIQWLDPGCSAAVACSASAPCTATLTRRVSRSPPGSLEHIASEVELCVNFYVTLVHFYQTALAALPAPLVNSNQPLPLH